MNATVLTSTSQRSRKPGHQPFLIRVVTWEVRRFLSSRIFWIQALGFWVFMLLIIWALRASDQTGTVVGSQQLIATFAVTSVRGLLRTLPMFLVMLVILLPFLNADGVTRDVDRRTYELLMTTALPTRAYVLGRYLAGLLMSLGLALILLASLLGMGGLLHLTDASYPLPRTVIVLLLWVGMVLSATILVSSVGFTFSTLYPARSQLIKVVIMVVWLIGALVIPFAFRGAANLPGWYVNWDPTSGMTALGLRAAYQIDLSKASITTEAQLVQYVLGIENKMPALAGWFTPHLLLAGLSLGLVLVTALTFRRSRATLSLWTLQ